MRAVVFTKPAQPIRSNNEHFARPQKGGFGSPFLLGYVIVAKKASDAPQQTQANCCNLATRCFTSSRTFTIGVIL
jgi:hypothetical protein